MTYTNGVQIVQTFDGKRILKSGAIGTTTVEEVQWLSQKLLCLSSQWKSEGWAYIVDVKKTLPVDNEVVQELIDLHKRIDAAGCKAMVFVDFAISLVGRNAVEYHKKSETSISEKTVRTQEEAFAYINTILK